MRKTFIRTGFEWLELEDNKDEFFGTAAAAAPESALQSSPKF